MKVFPFIVVLLFVGFSSAAQNGVAKSKPSKFIFTNYTETPKKGSTNFYKIVDSVAVYAFDSVDEEQLKAFNEMMNLVKDTLFSNSSATEIHLEIKNDSIWRNTVLNGKLHSDYILLEKDNGVLKYFDKSKSINYKTVDLFVEKSVFLATEDRKDRKKIRGFDCHKLTFISTEHDSNFGNTVYEMYVTEEIDLPVHAILNFGKFVPKSFPLQVRIWSQKLPELIEFYDLIHFE